MHVQSAQKILFFIVKYANLWGFRCRRHGGPYSKVRAARAARLFFLIQPIIFFCGVLLAVAVVLN